MQMALEQDLAKQCALLTRNTCRETVLPMQLNRSVFYDTHNKQFQDAFEYCLKACRDEVHFKIGILAFPSFSSGLLANKNCCVGRLLSSVNLGTGHAPYLLFMSA